MKQPERLLHSDTQSEHILSFHYAPKLAKCTIDTNFNI
jgi:hypothetical protein